MTGTKLPREMDTPAFRANLAAQVASRAEDAAIAAGTHADYAAAAADNGDADMAREHAAEGWQCSNEAEAAVKYIQAIGAQADGDGHSRAMDAANHAFAAAKAARAAYESAACNAEPQLIAGRDYDGTAADAERARIAKLNKDASEAGRAGKSENAQPTEKDRRTVWLRLLYLLRNHTADINAATNAGIIPRDMCSLAATVFQGPLRTAPRQPGSGPDWDDEIPF